MNLTEPLQDILICISFENRIFAIPLYIIAEMVGDLLVKAGVLVAVIYSEEGDRECPIS